MFKRIVRCSQFISRVKRISTYHVSRGIAQLLPNLSVECSNQKDIIRDSSMMNNLNVIISKIRPTDRILFLVQLEGVLYKDRKLERYLAIVADKDVNESKTCDCEICIIGFDVTKNFNGEDETFSLSVGLVYPIDYSVSVFADGVGGLVMNMKEKQLVVKPITIRAMWALLNKINFIKNLKSRISSLSSYFLNRDSAFFDYYINIVDSEQEHMNRWIEMTGVESHKSVHMERLFSVSSEAVRSREISQAILSILRTADLDTISFSELDEHLIKLIGSEDLENFTQFIQTETMILLSQLDMAACILPYLYLGTEMNACDYEELKRMGVTHVLNVTIEIDNFYPFEFVYKNVRVFDTEADVLLDKWQHTFDFIENARLEKGIVFVHCKMGISRSASTVVAYLMKHMNISADEGIEFVKSKRPIICPNKGFHKQLKIYEGMIEASNNRNSWPINKDSLVHGDMKKYSKNRKVYNSDTLNEFVTKKTNFNRYSTEIDLDSSDFNKSHFSHRLNFFESKKGDSSSLRNSQVDTCFIMESDKKPPPQRTRIKSNSTSYSMTSSTSEREKFCIQPLPVANIPTIDTKLVTKKEDS